MRFLLVTVAVTIAHIPSTCCRSIYIASVAAAAGLPRPVFLTQWNHRLWAVKAASRGYVACRYPGGDTGDSTGVFQAAYPNATWMKIYRRAWLGSRALDYMLTRSDVNPSIVRPHRLNWEQGSCLRCSHNLHLHSPVCQQVSITGHSRNGKQSLIAAAFDERITAVVGSSWHAHRFTHPLQQPAVSGRNSWCDSWLFLPYLSCRAA